MVLRRENTGDLTLNKWSFGFDSWLLLDSPRVREWNCCLILSLIAPDRVIKYLVCYALSRGHTRLHGSPYMDRPRPFRRAHKREVSGRLSGTLHSPKVLASLTKCEKGPE